jgi:aryl-alcohol dehydrogenase-like predicted oxidoreductase
VILGASKPRQVSDAIESLQNLDFSKEELDNIDSILGNEK